MPEGTKMQSAAVLHLEAIGTMATIGGIVSFHQFEEDTTTGRRTVVCEAAPGSGNSHQSCPRFTGSLPEWNDWYSKVAISLTNGVNKYH